MKQFDILGTGCARCKVTASLIEERAQEQHVEIVIRKVEDIREIMRHGVMATPGVVLDGTLVHMGSVPSRAQVDSWLRDH